MNKHRRATRRPLRAVRGTDDGDDGESDADGADDGRLDGGGGACAAVVGRRRDGSMDSVAGVVGRPADGTAVGAATAECGGHSMWPTAGGDGVTPDYGTASVRRGRRPRDDRRPRRLLQQLRCAQRDLPTVGGPGG